MLVYMECYGIVTGPELFDLYDLVWLVYRFRVMCIEFIL